MKVHKILLPTDGSRLARQAVEAGIGLARELDVPVVGLHVTPLPHPDQLEAWMHHDPLYAQRREALFRKFSDECLTFVANSALAAGVPNTCEAVQGADPYREIVATAERRGCDLICMASHGWHGNVAGPLGSETVKVLNVSKVPVLVYRPPSPHPIGH